METFDYDVVDKIYEPYDNLGLNVILHGDGRREYKVLGALAEAVKAKSCDLTQWNRLKEIFSSPSLQFVSFTITEKGTMPCMEQMAHGFPMFTDGYRKWGSTGAVGAMAVVTAMLYERYKAGKYPLALVSMDNCAQNGSSFTSLCLLWHRNGEKQVLRMKDL